MSNNESFIDEVTEEVRRDQLYTYLRRYGWIAGVVILGIVGGTAWGEYRASQDRTEAQARGDAIFAALNEADDQARQTALEALPSGVVEKMLEAAGADEIGDTEAAIAAYQAVVAMTDAPQIYREIASFKAALLAAPSMEVSEKISTFEALTQPGNRMRLLAKEQIALVHVENGDTETALALLIEISRDAELTDNQLQRVQELIGALGGAVEPA
jgi:hypothetical protein